MENFETTNTTDTATLATEGQRIAAFLIDSLLIGLVSLIPLLGTVIGLAYLLSRDALPFLDGQSIGKNLMKIRAVSAVDGSSLTNNWAASIIRNVVLFIPLFSIVELIVMFSNDQNQRLGDQWGKTKVISEPDTKKLF